LPREENYELTLPIEKTSKNNQVEYRAVLKGVYHEKCLHLKEFKMVRLERIPKCHNKKVNRLAQGASGRRPILALEIPADDWRKEIVGYLKDPSKNVDKRLRANRSAFEKLQLLLANNLG
jgi:hypothetical protein